MKIVINISDKDIKDYEKYKKIITDYPIYGHTSSLGQADIVAIGKLLEVELGNVNQTGKIIL